MARKPPDRARIELDPAQRSIEEGLTSVVRWALYQFHRRILETADVSIDRSTVSILTRLIAVGPMRNSELADYLELDRSTLSRQVSAAVAGGYVARLPDETDSRAYRLVVTDFGHETFLTVTQSRDEMIAEITRFMNESERELVSEALPVIIRALSQLDQSRTETALKRA